MVKAFDSKSNGIFPRRLESLLAASNLRALKKQEKLKERQTHWSCLGTLIAAMAEWLRRLTRNQKGSSRVGSSLTRSVRALHGQLWNKSKELHSALGR